MTTGPVSNPNQPSVVSILNSRHEIARSLGGNREAQLAAMVLEFSDDKRQRTGKQMLHTELAIREEGEREVAAMREQADAIQSGGTSRALGGVLGGAGMVTAGGLGLGGASEATQAIAQGSGEALKGGLEFDAAREDGRSKLLEADATEASNHAESATRRLERLSEAMDGADALADKALEFLDSIHETRAATNQAVTYRA